MHILSASACSPYPPPLICVLAHGPHRWSDPAIASSAGWPASSPLLDQPILPYTYAPNSTLALTFTSWLHAACPEHMAAVSMDPIGAGLFSSSVSTAPSQVNPKL